MVTLPALNEMNFFFMFLVPNPPWICSASTMIKASLLADESSVSHSNKMRIGSRYHISMYANPHLVVHSCDFITSPYNKHENHQHFVSFPHHKPMQVFLYQPIPSYQTNALHSSEAPSQITRGFTLPHIPAWASCG